MTRTMSQGVRGREGEAGACGGWTLAMRPWCEGAGCRVRVTAEVSSEGEMVPSRVEEGVRVGAVELTETRSERIGIWTWRG